MAIIAASVGSLFFVLALLLGTPASDGFIFAVGVTVALVPEGLLPTVTLSLAWGAEQMARRQVLVRDLDAVETLGSTTFICTDKTGTLTHNQMAVVEVWTPEGTALINGAGYEPTATVDPSDPAVQAQLDRLARAASRCSTGRVVPVETPDGRTVARPTATRWRRRSTCSPAGWASTPSDRAASPTERFPFDPRRRRMSVVVGGEVS